MGKSEMGRRDVTSSAGRRGIFYELVAWLWYIFQVYLDNIEGIVGIFDYMPITAVPMISGFLP